ncbi:MAG: hypothetical protein WA842_07215, partial [Croceibacterium sp.]
MNMRIGRAAKTAFSLGCCALALAAPALAAAQEAASGNEGEGTIVVTGSRVRGEAPVGSTVIALGRAEIEASSAVTVDRMIKEVPQVFD